MREYLAVIISLGAHHGSPDLAKPYAMSPTCAGQDEPAGNIEPDIFLVYDESRTVEMRFRQRAAYFQFLADCKATVRPDNLQ